VRPNASLGSEQYQVMKSFSHLWRTHRYVSRRSNQGQYVGSPLQLIEHVKFSPSSLHRKCGRSDLTAARQRNDSSEPVQILIISAEAHL
jgi:hypothetical protein